MVDIGVAAGIGLLVGGFSLMMVWGLVWVVVGAIGAIRRTCGWMIVLSSLSATVIASACAGGILWAATPSRVGSGGFAAGLAATAGLLGVTALWRLEDGRRIGPAFLEGSRLLRNHLWGIHREEGGCGHCHEQH